MSSGPTLAEHRVWVTGARGFLGSHVMIALCAAGADGIAFTGDVRDRDAVLASAAAAAPTVLLHLAARVDVSRDAALLGPMRDVIVGGAQNVLDAGFRAGARTLIVGTCEEYGAIPAPFHEDDVPSPAVSPYAAAKLEATELALRRASAQPVVVLRPFLTYGPGQRSAALVPAAIGAALAGRAFPMTDGAQTREWNYVEDTVAGLLLAMTADAALGRVVNVCGGPEAPVREVARLVFELAGASPALLRVGALPRRDGEVPRFFGDSDRCAALLGHVPRIGLRDGLARTIAAARQSGRIPA